jgi:hypothetical protein
MKRSRVRLSAEASSLLLLCEELKRMYVAFDTSRLASRSYVLEQKRYDHECSFENQVLQII